MTDKLLSSIRRLPLRIAQQHAGQARISYEQFKAQHPDGYFHWEDNEENGYFKTLDEMAEFERKRFEPEIDELNIPYTLRPCTPVRLKAPDAKRLLLDEQLDQEAPDDYPAPDHAGLQAYLDWWFTYNTKPWWTPEFERVIVLLPDERKLIYKGITGREYKDGDEPNESEFVGPMSADEVRDMASAVGQASYNVALLVSRTLMADPNWNEVDDGQEATPVDEEVKSLVAELEHEGWDVSIESVEEAKSDGDDEDDSDDEETSDAPEEA